MVLQFGWGVLVCLDWMRELSLVFSNGKAVRAISARNKQPKPKHHKDTIQEQRASRTTAKQKQEMDL